MLYTFLIISIIVEKLPYVKSDLFAEDVLERLCDVLKKEWSLPKQNDSLALWKLVPKSDDMNWAKTDLSDSEGKKLHFHCGSFIERFEDALHGAIKKAEEIGDLVHYVCVHETKCTLPPFYLSF